MSIPSSTPNPAPQEHNCAARETCTVYSVACDDSNGTYAQVFCLKPRRFVGWPKTPKVPTMTPAPSSCSSSKNEMTRRSGSSSKSPVTTSLPTASIPTTCNSNQICFNVGLTLMPVRPSVRYFIAILLCSFDLLSAPPCCVKLTQTEHCSVLYTEQ